jgi:hypothetical protein
VRAIYGHTVGALGRLGPAATVRSLDMAGRAAHAAGLLGPRAHDVAALFPWLDTATQARVARRIATLPVKNRAAIAFVEHGGGMRRVAMLLDWQADHGGNAILRPGAGTVILACHVGAFFGIRAALHAAGRDALTLRELPLDTAADRAAALKRGLECLQRGGLVVASMDGPGGTSTGEVECLERSIVLRRGPFALARLARAPLVPVACAWTEAGRIDVRVGNALDVASVGASPGEIETRMAAAAARWLDRYLRADPHELWPSTLTYFLAAPQTGHARARS